MQLCSSCFPIPYEWNSYTMDQWQRCSVRNTHWFILWHFRWLLGFWWLRSLLLLQIGAVRQLLKSSFSWVIQIYNWIILQRVYEFFSYTDVSSSMSQLQLQHSAHLLLHSVAFVREDLRLFFRSKRIIFALFLSPVGLISTRVCFLCDARNVYKLIRDVCVQFFLVHFWYIRIMLSSIRDCCGWEWEYGLTRLTAPTTSSCFSHQNMYCILTLWNKTLGINDVQI